MKENRVRKVASKEDQAHHPADYKRRFTLGVSDRPLSFFHSVGGRVGRREGGGSDSISGPFIPDGWAGGDYSRP
ncbi:hypothetical protein ANN_22106 [Periplaneta americana]|uniref:Uncharacterized protein n=1 Tax=Periplaneta americana TaxID=6978 RepID=A0ABQ8S7L2_PERAM|nr:hypothetical protein ANN_22106 [Periplaneta americana]